MLTPSHMYTWARFDLHPMKLDEARPTPYECSPSYMCTWAGLDLHLDLHPMKLDEARPTPYECSPSYMCTWAGQAHAPTIVVALLRNARHFQHGGSNGPRGLRHSE